MTAGTSRAAIAAPKAHTLGHDVDSTLEADISSSRRSGIVYVYKTGGGIELEGALQAPHSFADGQFGIGLAMSDNGERLLVAAKGDDDVGIAFAYQRFVKNIIIINNHNSKLKYFLLKERTSPSGGASWKLMYEIRQPGALSNDGFYSAVALNSVGSVLTVSSPGYDGCDYGILRSTADDSPYTGLKTCTNDGSVSNCFY